MGGKVRGAKTSGTALAARRENGREGIGRFVSRDKRYTIMTCRTLPVELVGCSLGSPAYDSWGVAQS